MLVALRVSAAEHEKLAQSCLKTGSRSVADFVRAAALQKAEALNAPGGNLTNWAKDVKRLKIETSPGRRSA
jgi:hypothetical protein